jgi:hypothetical protein
MSTATIQRERGLTILTGESEILQVAREVSGVVRCEGLDAAVIGGVAVVLHGHVRTTLDVDLYTSDAVALAASLRRHGFEFDTAGRQFLRRGVPIHLVTLQQIGRPPRRIHDLEGIRTVSLADLISIKLRCGTSDVLRAQDLADAIGLIRHHRLGSEFAAHVSRDVRPEFRKLARALAKARKRR